VRLEKDCLVYLRDDDVPILPKFVEQDADKIKLLRTWKDALNANHTVAKFESWPKLAVQVAADIGNVLLVKATAEVKGVPEAPLREVLKRLGETEVAEAEIPDRLAKAADELIRLRADLARLSNDRPEFAAIRARASVLLDRGDFDAARAALREGQTLADEMLEELSRTKAGFLADEARVDRLQLNYDSACDKFAEAARLDPDNVWLWIDLGNLWVTRGLLAEAEKAFFAARDAAACSRNDRDLCASDIYVGDVRVAQGDLAGALKSYRDSLAIRDPLAQSDPRNAGWQRDLSVSYDRVGDVQLAQGDLAGALKSYRDDLAIADRLARSDPGNTGWQRDLSISYNKIGDVKAAQDDLAGALKSYRDSLAIRDPLAQSDPSNADWQRDLSVSYDRVGDVQLAQGDFAGALKSYRDSLAIADRLAQSDPGNAGWQRDLAMSNGSIAIVLGKMGNGTEALAALGRGHAIMVRLTALSPDNAGWKRDLAWFEAQITEISG
jgi:tetratricopeptide (TPR) repeat protein